MDAPIIIAVTGAGVAAGGGLRWLYETQRAKRREPIDEMSLTAQASKAIAEASAALIIPLQAQLAFTTKQATEVEDRLTNKIDAMEGVVSELSVLIQVCQANEAICHERLTKLEEQQAEHAAVRDVSQAVRDDAQNIRDEFQNTRDEETTSE